MLNSNLNNCNIGKLASAQRKPSVLFKKKVETAKQRQERYLRRI